MVCPPLEQPVQYGDWLQAGAPGVSSGGGGQDYALQLCLHRPPAHWAVAILFTEIKLSKSEYYHSRSSCASVNYALREALPFFLRTSFLARCVTKGSFRL
jgi:hypothetical protein